MKPAEVKAYIEADFNTRTTMNPTIKRRRPVNPKLYTPKKRRYENPDAVCDICGITIGINEENHKLGYCRAGYLSTPVPDKDFEYSRSRYKRIRSVALHDFPP